MNTVNDVGTSDQNTSPAELKNHGRETNVMIAIKTKKATHEVSSGWLFDGSQSMFRRFILPLLRIPDFVRPFLHDAAHLHAPHHCSFGNPALAQRA
ncbi:hypothetical protein [Herbaspirillum robiniae]|uniref:hypothetical protein n=1 Tax=Herbaspirillum robiniae TaxID=2014887 RepID=UPI00101AD5D7|nr:hypothetical protein [Herbaspirillum robiniae]